MSVYTAHGVYLYDFAVFGGEASQIRHCEEQMQRAQFTLASPSVEELLLKY